ncbi:MAG: transposase [Fusobacteriaceae bacterium]|jgi:hypothetical protein|nr:transposase [Fusobacteriaceae bacterium]
MSLLNTFKSDNQDFSADILSTLDISSLIYTLDICLNTIYPNESQRISVINEAIFKLSPSIKFETVYQKYFNEMLHENAALKLINSDLKNLLEGYKLKDLTNDDEKKALIDQVAHLQNLLKEYKDKEEAKDTENTTLKNENATLKNENGTIKATYSAMESQIEDLKLNEAIFLDVANNLEEEKNKIELETVKLKEALHKANKDSTNSSIPSSKDKLHIDRKKKKDKENKKKDNTKGRPGAKKGHIPNHRAKFSDKEVDKHVLHKLDSLDCACGGTLEPFPEKNKTFDQFDTPPIVIVKIRHTAVAYKCPKCGKIHMVSIPEEIKKEGLIGNNLSALIAMLTAHNVTISGIVKVLEAFGCHVSRGTISQILTGKVSSALDSAYNEIRNKIPTEPYLGSDATGHKENGKHGAVNCIQNDEFGFFKITVSAAYADLIDLLGPNYTGGLECDFATIYQKLARETKAIIQFCFSHIKRDFNNLKDHPNKEVSLYGKRLLEDLSNLFHLIYLRNEVDIELDPILFNQIQDQLRRCAIEMIEHALDCPDHKEAMNMAKRFLNFNKEYFNFIDYPELKPTNNQTESTLRFVVILRSITQGTRSEAGRTFRERLWTTKATCDKQKKSLFEFIKFSLNAYCNNQPTPSLIAKAS